MPRNVLSYAAKVKLANRLEELLTSEGCPDGMVRYRDGWSDAAVAEELSDIGVNINHVSHARQELFGNLTRGGSGSSAALQNLNARVAELETAVDVLRKHCFGIT